MSTVTNAALKKTLTFIQVNETQKLLDIHANSATNAITYIGTVLLIYVVALCVIGFRYFLSRSQRKLLFTPYYFSRTRKVFAISSQRCEHFSKIRLSDLSWPDNSRLKRQLILPQRVKEWCRRPSLAARSRTQKHLPFLKISSRLNYNNAVPLPSCINYGLVAAFMYIM